MAGEKTPFGAVYGRHDFLRCKFGKAEHPFQGLSRLVYLYVHGIPVLRDLWPDSRSESPPSLLEDVTAVRQALARRPFMKMCRP
jgi:hypothetical protein